VAKDTLLVHFDSDVLFDVDSVRLDGSSRASLDQMAGVINEYRKTAVVVQGHTDATGSEEHNQGLSERRAGAVRNVLIGNGVEPSRVTALGYGETSPRASNDTPSGRQLNRRVDVMLRARG
jgi:outer membrane protein OmpA-like peptidoglycan-associated protein